MVPNEVTRVLLVFRSKFCLRKKERRMGKIKLKKVVFVTFLAVFSAIFGFHPIRTLDLIEIND